MATVVGISLGASSLPYGALCIRSLAENLEGDVPIHLLTDSLGDRAQLQHAFAGLTRVKVQVADELWADASNPMRRYAGLEKLRKGHPCWRKLTDPMLLARDGEEVVIVDPDVYFSAAIYVRKGRRWDAATDVAEAELPAAVLSGADGVCQRDRNG